MIEVNDAIQKVIAHTPAFDTTFSPLPRALGRLITSPILAPIAMPPFNQSAMDGYAICGIQQKFELKGEIKAGDPPLTKSLSEGEAIRIFTGAIIPENTTAVVKQEDASQKGKIITIHCPILPEMNIRKRGEEFEEGDLIIDKGTFLSPALIGLISTIGIEEIEVTKLPKISIIATGSELVKQGQKLLPGQIYESNSFMIEAAVRELGFQATTHQVIDDYSSTKSKLEAELTRNDILIVTGGISVGDYDFVERAFKEIGVKKVFHKVNQKPGKPVYFGIQNSKLVFGLPGNPAAALTCFYLYITPVLAKLSGRDSFLKEKEAALDQHYIKKGNRAHLLLGTLRDNKVKICSQQSSSMLSTFAQANCLIHITGDQRAIKQGNIVKVLILP